MAISEGALEVIIPTILIIFWIIILVAASCMTYRCLKKKPQTYKVVTFKTAPPAVEMQDPERFGYDQ